MSEVTSIRIPTAALDDERLSTLLDVNNYDVINITPQGMRESQYLDIVEACAAGQPVWVAKRVVVGFKRHIEKLLNLPFMSSKTPFVYGDMEVNEFAVLVEVEP